MRYTATSKSEQEAMLASLGLSTKAELFRTVPKEHRSTQPLAVLGPYPEGELLTELEALKTKAPRESLVGAGLYHHFIPSTARSLFQRSEWVTSYTPYQPETAQGTLVMYYEFQTYVALLTGQEIANGGMYDGSTALAEAVLMAKRLRSKAQRVFVSDAVHPEYRAVLATYLQFQDIEVVSLPVDKATGRTKVDISPDDQRAALAMVVQSPNFFGVIEDDSSLDPDAFVISVCAEAQSLAVLKPFRADIAVGEMQSLGIPVQLGGPTAGFFATKKQHVRQLPGRLVAKTNDRDGRDAYCITLATREQFIRREKATSNICTSSGLMCLRATIYLSLMGSAGLGRVARMSARAARAFRDGLSELGISSPYSGSCFNEFVVDLRQHEGLAARLEESGIAFGVPLDCWYPELSGHRLIALTELHYPRVSALLEEVARHVRS